MGASQSSIRFAGDSGHYPMHPHLKYVTMGRSKPGFRIEHDTRWFARMASDICAALGIGTQQDLKDLEKSANREAQRKQRREAARHGH